MIYLQYIKTFGGKVETLYDILEVSRKASKEVIEKAYKTLAKKYHPDLNPNDAIAREAMKEINRAYDTIKKSANKSYCDESQSATDAAKAQNPNTGNNTKSKTFSI